jgi:hypothetical protein
MSSASPISRDLKYVLVAARSLRYERIWRCYSLRSAVVSASAVAAAVVLIL